MSVLICGSLAFDTITTFPGRFAQQILPDQIPGLLRYARTIVWDEAAAEDLVSDTLVRALERSDSYRGDSSLSTCMTRSPHAQPSGEL